MGREIQVTTWYDIHVIKKELDNISGASKKLDYLMNAKLEKKKYSVSAKALNIGEQTQAELNDLIEYWKYKTNSNNSQKLTDEPEKEKSPSAKDFIDWYYEKKKIKIELIPNKTKLAKDIFRLYKKLHPNGSIKTYTTMLRDLPRT